MVAWAKRLSQVYGVSLYSYNRLLAEQGHACGICRRLVSEMKTRLVVDHNHKTEENRGLLCSTCNTGLGMFKENKEYLQNAIKYLDKYYDPDRDPEVLRQKLVALGC